MSLYYNVKTNAGDAAIATALANNTKLNITHVAFGDGGGSVPTPSKNRTTLVHEVHRQAVNKYTQHPTITKWLTIEAIIPSNIGGFWIREIGVIADNVLISHGSHAPFFKVADTEGVSEYRLKFTIDIQDASIVQLTLDESLIYASQAWVNENYVPRADIVNNLTTADATKPLSAKQGRELEQKKVDKTSIRKNFGNIVSVLTQTGYNFDDIMPGDYLFKDQTIETLNSPPFEYASVYCENTIGDNGQRFVIARDYFTGKLAVRARQNETWSGWSVIASIADNVASATKLNTARKINGVNFDGTADITVKNIWEFIPSGANLNDYTSTGTYYVDQDSVAATITNNPLPFSFSLEITQTAGAIQKITYYLGTGVREFKRAYYSGNWTVWDEVHSDMHKPDTLDTVLLSETTDEGLITALTNKGGSTTFFDNAGGKHFDQYSAGIFAGNKDAGFFGIAGGVDSRKIKAITGVVRANGEIDLLSKVTLLDNTYHNAMKDTSMLSWSNHESPNGWATGLQWKATPSTETKSFIGAFGTQNHVEHIAISHGHANGWSKGGGTGLWIDDAGVYTTGQWQFTGDIKTTGAVYSSGKFATESQEVRLMSANSRSLYINQYNWGAWDYVNNTPIALPVTSGGTGATSAEVARINLGLSKVENTSDSEKNVLSATKLIELDQRLIKPYETPVNAISSYFTTESGLNNSYSNTVYGDILVLNGYTDKSGGYINGLFFKKTGKRIYHYQAELDSAAWGTPQEIAYTTDNVASATKLQTARTISIGGAVQGYASFDGSGDILINTSSNHGVIRAYANFNGISNYFRKNAGIASIENQGNGKYLVTLSNAAPDVNYIVQATCSHARGDAGSVNLDPTFVQTVNQFRLKCNYGGDNTVGSFTPEFLNILITY